MQLTWYCYTQERRGDLSQSKEDIMEHAYYDEHVPFDIFLNGLIAAAFLVVMLSITGCSSSGSIRADDTHCSVSESGNGTVKTCHKYDVWAGRGLHYDVDFRIWRNNEERCTKRELEMDPSAGLHTGPEFSRVDAIDRNCLNRWYICTLLQYGRACYESESQNSELYFQVRQAYETVAPNADKVSG